MAGVARLFADLSAPWCIGGGHAVELAAGRAFREHGDVDVGVLLRPRPVRETLPGRVHDIWVRETSGGPWRPLLAGEQRAWLAAALVAEPGSHPWLEQLVEPP